MTTPTTSLCPKNIQLPLTKSYKMNLDTDVNHTLTNYNCGNMFSACVDKCKNVDPIIIWATYTTQKKIRMYLPDVGNIVARKIYV